MQIGSDLCRMSEIKWIKITTDMFDDEKIDFISSLPEGDSLIVVWVRLLTMAGKNNAGGYIFLTENIPFTEDMLAHKFRKSINVIKLALETFERLGMISFDEAGKIMITNWCKHQNIEGMDKVRELTRERVAKHRQLKSSNATCNVTVTQSNATDLDSEKELEKNKKKDIHKPNLLFDKFYKEYPKKKSPRDALKAWNKLSPDEELFNQIMDAVRKQKTSDDWTKDNGKFIPYPATWLNGQRWLDEDNTPVMMGRRSKLL